MPSLFVDLLALSIASAMGPGQIIFDTLLLLSPEGAVIKVGSFVAGMTTVRLIQGILFGFILSGAVNSISSSNQPNAISSTLLLVLGIALLITAYRQWQNEDDSDGSPPKWLSMIEGLTPIKAFGIGSILIATSPNLWVFTLNAIAAISEAQLSRLNSTTAFLLFILVAELLVLLPILMRILMPDKAIKYLHTFADWLNRNNRILMIVISLVFGLYFLMKGMANLLG
jgi:hypothetical protein